MRINKLVGVGLLVAVLAMVSGVAGFGASANTGVFVDFVIPSYIAIYADFAVTEMRDEEMEFVTGVYQNSQNLHVLSTTNWVVSDTIVWTTYPSDFNLDGPGADLFTVSYDSNSGTWGYTEITANYALDLEEQNVQYFPAGLYTVTVTHTATTNSGS